MNYILEHWNNRYIVFSVSYISPTEELEEIEKSLKNRKYKGIVAFDFYTINKNSFNRYLLMFFNGKKFESKLSKILRNPSDSLKSKSNKFYIYNKQLIDKIK